MISSCSLLFEKRKIMKSSACSADWRWDYQWGWNRPCSQLVGCGVKGMERGMGRRVQKDWGSLAWKRRLDQEWFLAQLSNEHFGATVGQGAKDITLNNSHLKAGLFIHSVHVYWAPTVKADTLLGSRAVTVNKTNQILDVIRLTF